MNKKHKLDKLFKLYGYLPHCLIYKGIYKTYMRSRFNKENSDITLISVICVGGEIYWILGLKFNSPFINSSIRRPAFMKLCNNLKEYLTCTPEYIQEKDHVIVKLKDIPVYFYHDDNIEEVKQTFERRLKRINWDKIAIIADDRKISEEELKQFDTIPYHKIMLSTKEGKDRYVLNKYKGQQMVGEYNEKSISGLWKFTYMWDYIPFVNHNFDSK